MTPSTKWTREAEDLAARHYAPFLLNHCLRSFRFAELVARREGIRIDREVVYLACLLHDLGLTEGFPGRPDFEQRGAASAGDFLAENGFPAGKAALVREAIAMHAGRFLADGVSPETRCVGRGIALDVIGMGYGDLPENQIARIVEAHPRLGFKSAFPPLLDREAESHPGGAIAAALREGFGRGIAAAPFAE